MPASPAPVTAPEPDLAVRRPSNRGFWLVAGSLLLACVLLVVEIFANHDIGDSISHAEHSLRVASAAAQAGFDRDGSYAAADAAAHTRRTPSLTFVDGDRPSTGLDQLSIVASDDGWAATVQTRPGACFYLRRTSGGDVFYGVGTGCAGRDALSAADTQW